MSDYPELPPELGVTDPEVLADLPELWRAVCEELLDEKFKTRTHLNRKTYEVGCHGPLCTKANRDFVYRMSERDKITRHRARRFDTALLFFYVTAERRIDEEKSRLIERIVS